MHIQKLDFYVSPLKLYSHLKDQRQYKNICMIHDGTEKGFSAILHGGEVLKAELKRYSKLELVEIFDVISARLKERESVFEEYVKENLVPESFLNLPFVSGLAGFFSYEFGHNFEDIESHNKNDRTYPAYYFVDPHEIIIFDHDSKTMWVVFTPKNDEVFDEEFYQGLRNIHFKLDLNEQNDLLEVPLSNLSKEEYTEKIEKVKEYLQNGETYQVNFSQRFSFQSLKSPFSIYKEVTKINPSKYQAFLHADEEDFYLLSNSPERLFKVSVEGGDRYIETRPIKGTARLSDGMSREDIARVGQELVMSEKDRAELEMIVDMSRNDLGRICEFGSVEVNEHRTLERYSHLLHTVSNVKGVLKENVSLYDIFRALFPGASITGCPKKRTMEIIDELEEFYRGVYCGSFGYFDCRGNMDFNIMIRTLHANTNHKAGYSYVMNSGGGIVFDSTPELEFDETYDKINAFLQAINS